MKSSRFFPGSRSAGSASQGGRFAQLKSLVRSNCNEPNEAVTDAVSTENLLNDGVKVISPSLEVCSICLCCQENAAKTDGCAHEFCWACICIWAKISVKCPLCKSEFRIVRSLGQPALFQEFEAPLCDSESEDDYGDEEEEEDEGEEGNREGIDIVAPVAVEEAVDGSDDGYEFDGFVVDDDEIEYEENHGGAEAEEDIAEFASDSEGDEGRRRMRRRRKKKRRRIQLNAEDGDDDGDNDDEAVKEKTPEVTPLSFSSFAFK